jgi:hypothetical protein
VIQNMRGKLCQLPETPTSDELGGLLFRQASRKKLANSLPVGSAVRQLLLRKLAVPATAEEEPIPCLVQRFAEIVTTSNRIVSESR